MDLDIQEEVCDFNHSSLPSVGVNLANPADDDYPSQVPSTFLERKHDVFEGALVARPKAPRGHC